MSSTNANQTPSRRVVDLISDACYDALFCGFKVYKKDGRWVKQPLDADGGLSVGKNTSPDRLLSFYQDLPPGADYWGVFMQRPTLDSFNKYVLTVLDIDTKNSEAPPNIALKRLVVKAKELGLLVEDSFSDKGKHIIFLAKEDASLPPKIYIESGQEIEVFGHPNSAGKNVMLTGKKLSGQVMDLGDMSLRELLTECGITVDAKKERPTPAAPLFDQRSLSDEMQRAADALHHINIHQGQYQEWIEIGMALHAGFGDQGLGLWINWSSTQPEFKGEQDCASHWKSFSGQGPGNINLGTLFHRAKEGGWAPPSKAQIERTSAIEDFNEFITKNRKNIDPDTGEITQAAADDIQEELFWKPIDINFSTVKGIDYILEGFLAESFAVLAGQPGGGKTTATVPMCLAAAGFKIGDLEARDPRKIIYVSEDTEQVIRILQAFIRFEGLDADKVKEQFILIDARRVNAKQLVELHKNVTLATTNSMKPWLVLDTASATMDLKDENDNAGVSQFVSAIKEIIYVRQKAPVLVITHTAKAMSRADEDATARGASAWEGDATLTATLFVDGDQRYIKLRKTRYEPEFREILLETRQETIAVLDRKGRMQDLRLTWTIPRISDEQERKANSAAQAQEARSIKSQAIIDQCHTAFLAYASQFNNPVIYIGRGNHKVPDGCHRLSLKDWLEHCGIDGTSDSNKRPGIIKALQKMLSGGAVEGWVRC